MPQFFINSGSLRSGRYIIHGDDFHHLVNVRRVKENDIVVLRDENGRGIKTRIVLISETEVELEPVAVESNFENRTVLTLYASILKGKKFDLVIQKCVEVGVSRIVPVIAERSISRISDGGESKLKRWRRIADEAAKQCMASMSPVIHDIINFNDLIKSGTGAPSIIADPGGQVSLHEYLGELKQTGETGNVNLLVGPEGGFSRDETEIAESSGWVRASFRNNQLRAETASIVLSSIILYELGGQDEYNP